jgi:hypothetical protein
MEKWKLKLKLTQIAGIVAIIRKPKKRRDVSPKKLENKKL